MIVRHADTDAGTCTGTSTGSGGGAGRGGGRAESKSAEAGAGAETGADPVARFYRETVALTDPVAVRAQLESGVCVRHFTPITITTAAPRRQQQGGQLGD